ncbi:MAG: hypothetical protein U0Q16_21580 [Bryobacteraceae bacterium]
MHLTRTLLIWVAIMAAETIHGTLRTLFLAPWIGDFRARQLATFVGSLIIFAIAYWSVEWLGASSRSVLLAIGGLWAALTLAFEAALGRALGFSWDRILEDYDVSRGGLMAFGIAFLALSPWIAHKLRGIAHHWEATT